LRLEREGLGSGFVSGCGLVSGSRSRLVSGSWGRLVCGSRGRLVSRSWLVGLGFVFGVDSFSRVADISNIAVVVISSVGHSLDTAIGKGNSVRSRDGFAVSGFLGSKVGTRVVILDSVFISIRLRRFIIGGFLVGRGRFVWSRGRLVGGWGWGIAISGGHHGGNNSNKSKHDEGVCFDEFQKLN